MHKADDAGGYEMNEKTIAICSCPTGVAQTYMGAQALKEAFAKRGWSIKIETQGAFGVENALTKEDIEEATYVLLASYRKADQQTLAAFTGKKVYEVDIHEVVRNVEKVVGLIKS